MTVPNTSYCTLEPGIKIITMCVLCESAGIPLSLQNFNEPISTHWGIYVHCWVDVVNLYYLIGKLSVDILVCACHTLVFLSSLFQTSFCSGWLLFLYFVLLCCCFVLLFFRRFGATFFWFWPINSALLFQYELHNIYVVLIIYIYIYIYIYTCI